MRPTSLLRPGACILLATLIVGDWGAPAADSACCFVAAPNGTVRESAERIFLSYDPEKKIETLAIQPRFEGSARDFAMIVVTPSLPRVDELPRDFFHELALFTTLQRRTWPESKLKDPPRDEDALKRPAPARVLDEGTVGTLKHQSVTADKVDDLYAWLRENRYQVAGAEEDLKGYVDKKWCFTFLKIDPAQLPKGDGTLIGEVRPIRLTFATEQFIYPLRINRVSAGDHLEVVFTIQAPYKVDLPGALSYQYQWVPMLLNSRGAFPKGTFGDSDLPGTADDWLKAIEKETPALLRRGQDLGFGFTNKTRPQPNRLGRSASTLEWARRLSAADIRLLKGQAAYGETVPDPDEGFTVADLKDPARDAAIAKVIAQRKLKLAKERPGGYLVRTAPPADVKNLKVLLPHLQEGHFVTRVRKVFSRDEMKEDVVLEPAKLGQAKDTSEYTELLPASPP